MLGFRFWDFTVVNGDPVLCSVTSPFKWEQNVVGNKVSKLATVNTRTGQYRKEETHNWRSFIGPNHPIPEIGFMAYKRLSSAIHESDTYARPLVVGAVNGFGRVAVHESGWRAEFCQILGFLGFIPCSSHPATNGNIIVKENYNISFCNQHSDLIKNSKEKPIVQFEHDFFFKTLCNRYEVEAMSFKQLTDIGDK